MNTVTTVARLFVEGIWVSLKWTLGIVALTSPLWFGPVLTGVLDPSLVRWVVLGEALLIVVFLFGVLSSGVWDYRGRLVRFKWQDESVNFQK